MLYPNPMIPNLDDPSLVGPLRLPRKQYAYVLGGFIFSVSFAVLIAGLANGLIVCGLWLVTLFPFVRGAILLRRWKMRRERRLTRENAD
jgi:hypothetical protein